MFSERLAKIVHDEFRCIHLRKSIEKYNKKLSEDLLKNGGGGIRTHGTLADTLVFKTRALNHSTTPPGVRHIRLAKTLYHNVLTA